MTGAHARKRAELVSAASSAARVARRTAASSAAAGHVQAHFGRACQDAALAFSEQISKGVGHDQYEGNCGRGARIDAGRR